MFNSQETLFLEAIQKMLSSTEGSSRQKVEQDINLWAKESYLQIIEACNKFIICENLEINTRRYACYIITILVRDEYYDSWDKLPKDLKEKIKINSLGLLGNPSSEIRLSASSLVADIKQICAKNNEWPDLIETLCNASKSDKNEFKISAIKTLGIIFEKLNKNNFSDVELALMENTLIQTMLSCEYKNLVHECLRSYQYFINYIYHKFNDSDYLKSTLQMLTSFCNLKKYDEEICIKSIHRISDVVLKAYNYMESLIRNIIEFFGLICNDENENLAIQSYIFLIELSQEEYSMNLKNKKSKNYIDSCWDLLWPVIQNTLNNSVHQQNNNEQSRLRALSDLLFYISKICEDNIINDIFIYMQEKISSKDPLMINSAIYLFSSILESVHKHKLKKVVLSSIPIICDFLKMKNEALSETVCWCIKNICENFGELIIRASDVFNQLMETIIYYLKIKEINSKIKMYLCSSIYNLTIVVKNSELLKLGVFSQYLLDLIKILDYLAYLPSSYNNENNLSNLCFLAISGLIKSSSEQNEEILFLYLDQLLERFKGALDRKNFNGDKEYLYQFQDSLCLVLTSFCERANRTKFAYNLIESFFNIIEVFFQKRGIFENGLLALSKLSFLISSKEFNNFMKIIMEHIFTCLQDYQDFSNCKNALLCLIDLITTSKENFSPYIDRLIQNFQEIIKKPDANKELFSYFLIIYSDMFQYIGESIWKFVKVPLEYMNFVLKFCIDNYDYYLSNERDKDDCTYFLILNDNIMDLIENILKRISLEAKERQKAFEEYIPNIIYYLNFMFQKPDFIPDKDFFFSCISILFDLIEIYKDDALKLLENKTSRRINSLSEESGDDEIMTLNDALQNCISSQQCNLQLNIDDIF